MAALDALLQRTKHTGRITAEDTLTARRAVFPDGHVDRAEVDALFALDEAAEARCEEWAEFFIEALGDFLVRQESPQGYISQANADWLTARIAEDGRVKTATELALLVRALEIAERAPASLSAFALDQVRRHVLAGDAPRRVTADDAALVRRVLYAYGGDGGAGVTREEGEVLFDIHEAAADGPNDPEWNDLFAKALANMVMAASGYTAPPREVALARETWLKSESGGVLGFVSRMAGAAAEPQRILEAYRAPSSEQRWEARNDALQSEIARAEPVTAPEADWLAERIRRDGRMTEAEAALMRFLRDESPDIHPALKPLIDAA